LRVWRVKLDGYCGRDWQFLPPMRGLMIVSGIDKRPVPAGVGRPYRVWNA